MTPRERMRKALAHEETDLVPYVIPIDPTVDAELTKHYGGPQYRERITNHYVNVSPTFTGIAEGPHPEGSILDVFGGRWEVKNICHLVDFPLKRPSVDGLEWPDVSKEEYYAPLHDVPRQNPDRFTIALFALGLFERSWALRGMNNILMDMACEPAFCDELYDQIVEWNLKLLGKMCDTPVDAVGFTDDLGCQKGLIMGPLFWKRYLRTRMATLIGFIKSRGKYSYLHSCGDNSDIMADLIEMGLDVFNPLQPEPWDIFGIKKQYGRHITFDGGISSQTTLPFGSVEDVQRETRRCLRELGRGGGYVAGPNKPIMAGTPVENAVALIETLVTQ